MRNIQSSRAMEQLAVLIAATLAVAAVLTGAEGDIGRAAEVAAVFATLAWGLRGVNPGGAVAGGALAFVFCDKGGRQMFCVLLVVFVITLAATKIAAFRKGSAQVRKGRSAAQVTANLVVAASLLLISGRGTKLIACAALAELAADTVSSELGEMFKGKTFLITSGRRVPAGTNGGLSIFGTFCGFLAAMAVATAAFLLDVKGALWIPEVAGLAGMFVDSWLGATLENKGWLNNEAVNLLGTGSAAAIAWTLIRWNG